MKQSWFFAEDNRANNWLFFTEKKGDARRLRERYLPLVCQQCGKFDEIKAVREGIDDDVVIRSRFDYVCSSDEIICVSVAFKELIEELGNPDCEFIPLPGDSRYFVCLVKTIAPCEDDIPEMTLGDQCPQCGRYKFTAGGPPLSRLNLPESRFLLCLPDFPNETLYFRRWLYLGAAEFVQAVKKRRLKGIAFFEAS